MLPSELNAVVGLAIRQALEYEFQLLTTYIPVFHVLRSWFICMFYLLLVGWPNRSGNLVYMYVVVNFLSRVIFIFPVSTSLAYITIPKNKRKTKIT